MRAAGLLVDMLASLLCYSAAAMHVLGAVTCRSAANQAAKALVRVIVWVCVQQGDLRHGQH